MECPPEMSLLSTPNELLVYIVSYLPLKDSVSLSCTCKDLRTFVLQLYTRLKCIKDLPCEGLPLFPNVQYGSIRVKTVKQLWDLRRHDFKELSIVWCKNSETYGYYLMLMGNLWAKEGVPIRICDKNYEILYSYTPHGAPEREEMGPPGSLFMKMKYGEYSNISKIPFSSLALSIKNPGHDGNSLTKYLDSLLGGGTGIKELIIRDRWPYISGDIFPHVDTLRFYDDRIDVKIFSDEHPGIRRIFGGSLTYLYIKGEPIEKILANVKKMLDRLKKKYPNLEEAHISLFFVSFGLLMPEKDFGCKLCKELDNIIKIYDFLHVKIRGLHTGSLELQESGVEN